MAEYGLEVYNSQGKKTLSVTDRLGRFLGSFYVPELKNGSRRTTFNIPVAHQNKGKMFVWYDPDWIIRGLGDFYAFNISNSITITSTQIHVDISTSSKWVSDLNGQRGFEVFYGVF